MHSVCASMVLNGYTFPEVWCLEHMHSVCASVVHISKGMVSRTYAFQYVQVWYTFLEVWCLRHMHSVCASAALKACIFPKVWCLKHMHSVCAIWSAGSPQVKWTRKWKLAGAVLHVWGACLCKCGLQHPFIFQVMMVWALCIPACVLSMPVQVLPSISLYFVGYGPSNTCILYLQEPVESPADACTGPRNRPHFTSPTRNASRLVGNDAAATCCMEEDVSLGTSYGSLAVLLHMGACSQSVSVSTDGGIWQQHPAFWSAWATRNCYQVSRWVATAAHACFIVAQSYALVFWSIPSSGACFCD